MWNHINEAVFDYINNVVLKIISSETNYSDHKLNVDNV